MDCSAKLYLIRRGVVVHGSVDTTESLVIDKLRTPDGLWYQVNRSKPDI